MSTTYTTSTTFTRTNALYLASKVAADLRQMQLFYGKPTLAQINQYIQELLILLLNGYLESVDYGFQKNGNWVTVISYSANFSSMNSADDRSGGVIPGMDISGAVWKSYLRKNSSYWKLSSQERERIEQQLPFTRTSTEEPGFEQGEFLSDKSYYSGGASLERRVFKPY